MRKFVLSDESINSYGFRVLTAGIDTETRYAKNPVILFMHNGTLMSVGKMKIEKEGSKLVGVPEFDLDDPIGRELQRKYEKGYMNGFSLGIDPLEFSALPEHLLPGQKFQTATKSLLYEISAVNIPSNANAVRLSADYENAIPNVETNNQNPMKRILLHFNLAENATEDDVLVQLSALADENKKLKSENEAFKTEQIAKKKQEFETLLANPKKNLSAEQKEAYRKLAETDLERAKELVQLHADVVQLHKVPGNNDTNPYQGKTFAELQKESPNYLAKLKAEQPDVFAELYKAQFGTNPK